MRALAALVIVGGVIAAAACSRAPAPESVETAANASAGPRVESAPQGQDEDTLQALASRALTEQRLYAPAGDNAIEHYLALRGRLPGDPGIETALLELLPYAQIAAEQATARGDWSEAQRLIALVEATDPRLPAIARLRDRLAIAQADAERLAAEQARQAAEADERRLAAGVEVARVAPSAALPATTAPPASPAAAQARPAEPTAVAAAPARTEMPARPAPAAASAAATPVPALLQAPQPRYPLMALRRKLEGEVTLELSIAADGRVARATVVSATHPGLFDEAAVSAAERWRFAPGPEAVTTRQVMRFRLPGAASGRGP